MSTLVTGATGFVGSHIARLLVERGEQVRVLVRRTSLATALDGIACERVMGDLRETVHLKTILRGTRRV
ncbi:MAG TPA: GDP-mannose 4,6-dehydratase, partial [Candidatus Acidoferrales bacterium]|nr:GDP-mannose 4,6-dehydratase [Candidatus Acidoferrales bacterium]